MGPLHVLEKEDTMSKHRKKPESPARKVKHPGKKTASSEKNARLLLRRRPA